MRKAHPNARVGLTHMQEISVDNDKQKQKEQDDPPEERQEDDEPSPAVGVLCVHRTGAVGGSGLPVDGVHVVERHGDDLVRNERDAVGQAAPSGTVGHRGGVATVGEGDLAVVRGREGAVTGSTVTLGSAEAMELEAEHRNDDEQEAEGNATHERGHEVSLHVSCEIFNPGSPWGRVRTINLGMRMVT